MTNLKEQFYQTKNIEFLKKIFIGTQCDLWGRPDGTGHEKISRGKFPRLTFSLIPSSTISNCSIYLTPSLFKYQHRFLWVVSHLYSSKDNISSIIRFKSTDCWMESQDLHCKSSTSRCQYDPEQPAKCSTAPGSVMGLRSASALRHRRELHPHLRTQFPPAFSLTAYSFSA